MVEDVEGGAPSPVCCLEKKKERIWDKRNVKECLTSIGFFSSFGSTPFSDKEKEEVYFLCFLSSFFEWDLGSEMLDVFGYKMKKL